MTVLKPFSDRPSIGTRKLPAAAVCQLRFRKQAAHSAFFRSHTVYSTITRYRASAMEVETAAGRHRQQESGYCADTNMRRLNALCALTADDEVDLAESLEGLGDGGADLSLVTDVGGSSDALLAAARLALQLGGRLGETLGAGGVSNVHQ